MMMIMEYSLKPYFFKIYQKAQKMLKNHSPSWKTVKVAAIRSTFTSKSVVIADILHLIDSLF